MRRHFIFLFLLLIFILSACDMASPDERAIRQMVKTFVAAIDKDDTDLANACLLDQRGFETLNPDASARSDAESFVASYMADLFHSYSSLRRSFEGRAVELKEFKLGVQFYQYKGFTAFKDSEVIVSVDGDAVDSFNIGSIVRIGERWVIVELGGIDY